MANFAQVIRLRLPLLIYTRQITQVFSQKMQTEMRELVFLGTLDREYPLQRKRCYVQYFISHFLAWSIFWLTIQRLRSLKRPAFSVIFTISLKWSIYDAHHKACKIFSPEHKYFLLILQFICSISHTQLFTLVAAGVSVVFLAATVCIWCIRTHRPKYIHFSRVTHSSYVPTHAINLVNLFTLPADVTWVNQCLS